MRTPVIHGVHHDLVSFHRLLIRVVLCHTDHMHRKGNKACSNLFDSQDETIAEGAKLVWLLDAVKHGFGVRDNVPFTHLLSRLTRIVSSAISLFNMSDITLAYRPVLEALDKALDMEG